MFRRIRETIAAKTAERKAEKARAFATRTSVDRAETERMRGELQTLSEARKAREERRGVEQQIKAEKKALLDQRLQPLKSIGSRVGSAAKSDATATRNKFMSSVGTTPMLGNSTATPPILAAAQKKPSKPYWMK
jgi:hypothetical protein